MGKKKVDPMVNVIDVEATCWDNRRPPKGMNNEIIEIGITTVDTINLSIVDNEGIIISPIESTISPFCTSLTSITQEEIDRCGIEYRKALYRLVKKYKSKKRMWISWGAYDKNIFKRQCKRQKVEYPFGPNHVNFKTLSALSLAKNEVGMQTALGWFNLGLQGKHHRGVDDSYNIACMFINYLRLLRN